MDNEQETAGAGVSRGQNQLHVIPEDWHAAGTAIAPITERVDPALDSTQLVVVTPDAEAAAGIAERVATRAAARGLRVLAATSARRAIRVQRQRAAHVVLGDPATLVALLESTTLKLDGLKAAVLAWIDEAAAKDMRALEALMAEVPKDAARIVLVSAVTPAVDELVERYARRPRRVAAGASDAPPVSLSFVAVSESGRLPALRRVLDILDPASAYVLVRDESTRDEVRARLRSLGYGGDADTVRVGDAPTPGAGTELLILYDPQGNEEQLRPIVSSHSGRVVALVTPRQIASLRRIAGGTVSPLLLPEAAQRARTREESLRDELRRTLESGQISRELIALEPLLAEHDGAEVAAAALRLLETERARAAEPPAADAPRPMTRLFLNIGSTDHIGPGDLVGAITNEAGVARAELGRVDVRERHSTIEVATPIANSVVSKVTGISIRGRRVIARVDEGPERRERPDRHERPSRGDAPRGRGPGGPRRPGGRSPSGRPGGRGRQ